MCLLTDSPLPPPPGHRTLFLAFSHLFNAEHFGYYINLCWILLYSFKVLRFVLPGNIITGGLGDNFEAYSLTFVRVGVCLETV